MDIVVDEASEKLRQNQEGELNHFLSSWNKEEARGKLRDSGLKKIRLTPNPLLVSRLGGTKRASEVPENCRGLYSLSLEVVGTGYLALREQPLWNEDDDFAYQNPKMYTRKEGNWWEVKGAGHMSNGEVLSVLLDYGFTRERLRNRFTSVLEKANK